MFAYVAAIVDWGHSMGTEDVNISRTAAHSLGVSSCVCLQAVSSYPLDLQGIASMVDGNLMPRPLAILASLVAVSFIGAGDLLRNWIHSIFRVRRRAVCRALLWLKENNQKYYGNVHIDEGRLHSRKMMNNVRVFLRWNGKRH